MEFIDHGQVIDLREENIWDFSKDSLQSKFAPHGGTESLIHHDKLDMVSTPTTIDYHMKDCGPDRVIVGVIIIIESDILNLCYNGRTVGLTNDTSGKSSFKLKFQRVKD